MSLTNLVRICVETCKYVLKKQMNQLKMLFQPRVSGEEADTLTTCIK